MRTKRCLSGAVLLALTSVLTTACSTTGRRPGGRAPAKSSAPTAGPTEERLPTRSHGAEEGDSPAPEPRGTAGLAGHGPAGAGGSSAYTTHDQRPAGHAGSGLKVSTSAAGYRVLGYRIGSYRGGSGALVWRAGSSVGERQAGAVLEPVETRTVVAPWRRSLTLDTTGWEPGFYVLKLRTGRGWETAVPYVVSSPSARGTVALVAPVTTWQAYNQWGGYSLYAGPAGDRRSWAVSFDRPYNLVDRRQRLPHRGDPLIVSGRAAAPPLGIPLSYYTNVDLDQDPGVLAGARGYVSMGHDEYWTPAMREAVERARDGGTNLAFLGANTMYWRIRLDDAGSGRPGCRPATGPTPPSTRCATQRPAEATSRFRDVPAPEPEQDPDRDEVRVLPGRRRPTSWRRRRWWGFRGTGVRAGDRFAGLVGPEADRVYLDARTPRPMEVLSHTPYSCRGVATSSQSVYYTTRPAPASSTRGRCAGAAPWSTAASDPLGARTQRLRADG